MSARTEFMRKILADRDDDTHRLVFADWLSENGEEERAQLIRVQCRLEQIEREFQIGVKEFNEAHKKANTGVIIAGTLVSPEKDMLEKQERKLLSYRRVFEWMHFTGHLSGMPAVSYNGNGLTIFYYDNPSKLEISAIWRRGFIDALSCKVENWIRYSGSIWPNEDEPYYDTAHPLKKVTFIRWNGLNALHKRLAGINYRVSRILHDIRWNMEILEGQVIGQSVSQIVNTLFGKIYPGLEFSVA